MKDNVWVAHVTTEGGDHYLYAYSYKPERKDVAKTVWLDEGQCADLEWYEDILSVDIQQVKVLKKLRKPRELW